MMRSMYSGVSGLRVHQTKMDVIGNNIANVNTIGFKSQRVNFNEVFSQTLQGATSANDDTGRGGLNPMQVGLGVNVSSIDILMTQGAAQRTDNPFDLMINGEGFIVVGDDSGRYFTRAGALRQDDQGNLVVPNGMKVMGWTQTRVDEKGKEEIVPGEIRPISLGDPQHKTAPPQTTTKAELSGNLDRNSGTIPTQIKMYDSLGNLYTTQMELTYIEAEGDEPAHWLMVPVTKTVNVNGVEEERMVLKDAAGNEFAVKNVFNTTDGNSEPKRLEFNTDGSLVLKGDDSSTVKLDYIDLNQAVDPENGTPKGLNAYIGHVQTNTNAAGDLEVNEAGSRGVQVNLAHLTQFASKTTVDPKAIDGKAAGVMMGFNVGVDGKITAFYDNGSTKLLGQICLAQFDNPAGLEKVGDNLFKQTANSGDFDNIGKSGHFQAGVLEMSNVDLSREFTDMITTQRGFQANSRIISVSDEMLQELVNLKR